MSGNTYRKAAACLALAAFALAAAPAAKAGDFDGSKPLLCAPVEVIDCVPGTSCFADTPTNMGAPPFLRIDFAGKTITGPRQKVKIADLATQEKQLLLQGIDTLGHAFAIALDRQSGRMTVTLSDVTGAFVLFGSCTPL